MNVQRLILVGGGTITSIENFEELANMLNTKMHNRSGGSNRRLAQMLGILTKDNQIKANIPSKDRSMFSQQKWQFFLDEGAPNISHLCCNVMKKEPAHRYAKETERVGITGQTASESRLRTQQWLRNGCNAFDNKNPVSNPLSVWTEQDILLYIKLNNIEICSVYGEVVEDSEKTGQLEGQISLTDYSDEYGLFDIGNPALKTTGCKRTGCMFCGFGSHCNGDDRFIRMKETHPKIYDYVMRPWEEEVEIVNPKTGKKQKIIQKGLNYKEVIEWINKHGNVNIRY